MGAFEIARSTWTIRGRPVALGREEDFRISWQAQYFGHCDLARAIPGKSDGRFADSPLFLLLMVYQLRVWSESEEGKAPAASSGGRRREKRASCEFGRGKKGETFHLRVWARDTGSTFAVRSSGGTNGNFPSLTFRAGDISPLKTAGSGLLSF